MKFGKADLIAVVTAGVLWVSSGGALAQRGGSDGVMNPVYLADAPVAIETIERARALVGQGSVVEAARSLSQLIVEQGDRLTPRPDDGFVDGAGDDEVLIAGDETSITVRARIEGVLLGDDELLAAYRRLSTPKAQRMIDEGDWERAALDYWLTEPGCDAALNSAQVLIESGRFGGGMRKLDRLLVHPDAGSRADRGRTLALLAYQATGDDRALETARAWGQLSGVALVEREVAARLRGAVDQRGQVSSLSWTPLDVHGGDSDLRLEGIVSYPIATARLTPWPSKVGLAVEGGIDDSQISGAVTKPKPWAVPVVVDDALITNDGVTISCFDRFTLRERWRVTTTASDDEEQDRTSVGVRARLARTIEDVSSVTVVGDRVYVAAGLARTGARTGDERLLSIDLESGAVIASTTLAQLDPELEGSTIRGSVIVDGDVLVVSARKNLRRERLVAVALVGIDRRTLEHVWTRQIGSAGSLPFQQIGQIAHSGVLDRGVVYWTDMMGIACAVESATGGVLWAKALPTSDVYGRYERDPWTVSTPIIRDDAVFVLSVDGRRIQKLDKQTGRLLASTSAMISGQGLYLVDTPDDLVCVNQTEMTLHPVDRFGVIRAKTLSPTGDSRESIVGRVFASGSTLVVPVADGLSLVDTKKIGQREFVELDGSGIAAALDGQVLVANENEVSSFLSWDIARRLLIERIDSGDLHAAITLSDLALRSGHHDEIIPAIDRAITMLRKAPAGAERDGVQSRLFAIMLDIAGLPTANNGLGSPDAQGADERRLYMVEAPIRSALLERAGRIASGSGQVLAHQMTMGAWATALGDIDEAVGIYHGVLQDEALSAGMWRGGGLAIRAEIEATHQLDEIVALHGRGVCRVFDELAIGDLEVLKSGGIGSDDPLGYEQLARRYPWSPTTGEVWRRAVELWDSSGNAPAAVWAARAGLDAVGRLDEHGVVFDQATVDVLGSKLIGGLLESRRHEEAAREATALLEAYPSVTIEVDGERIEPGVLWAGLGLERRGPWLGDRFVVTDQPALLAGSPVRSTMRSAFDTMVMFAPQLAQARMVRFTSGQPEVVWTRRSPGIEPPVVVVQSEFQTVLQWPPAASRDVGGSIEAVETLTGQTRWRIGNAGQTLGEHSTRVPDRIAGIDRQFTSPTEGAVPIDQVLISSDGSVMVVADRIGRTMGVDLLSGLVMWTRDMPINRVHDMDVRGGVLGMVGMWVVDGDVDAGIVEEEQVRVLSIDVRTGQTIQLLDGQTAMPRWIRVAASGNLIVGTNLRVMSVSTRTGALDWMIRSQSLMRSNAGWIIEDTLVVLDEYVDLWAIGLRDGAAPGEPLRTASRVVERGWADVRGHGDDLVVAASAGMGVFAIDGESDWVTKGIDAQRPTRPYMGAAWGDDRVVLVGRAGAADIGDDDSMMRVLMRMMDQGSAEMLDSRELLLPSAIQRQPTSVQAGEGVVVVGFGEVSVVVETE